jgi:hypothetical protein
MNLIKQEGTDDCVAAALAMVFDVSLGYIKAELFTDLMFPFPEPWDKLPKVPDMNVICDYAMGQQGVALVPFELDPLCSPHVDCKPVPVWPRSKTATARGPWKFEIALRKGPGLIEGTLTRNGNQLGHMVAWDGTVIYDPRGYCYSTNVAMPRFNFQPRRFWLAISTRK